MSGLTHFSDDGASHMVDVSGKSVTQRMARAGATIVMQPETLRLILDRGMSKGDVLEVARLAGIIGAKRTADLIPLCHPLPLDSVEVGFRAVDEVTLNVEATVRNTGRTGVEMEALTAVTVASLTVYDMCKAVDRGMEIGVVRLLEKSGGRSGHFLRTSGEHPARNPRRDS